MQQLLRKIGRLGFRALPFWSGVFMILLVLTGATAVLFADLFDDRLYGAKRTGFVILMLSYAVYRFFRLRQLLREVED